MRDLAVLDPSRLDEGEHAALCWVRETLTRREGASPRTVEGFERLYDERQRACIVAAMKSMYFFNLAGNTLDGWLRRLLGRPTQNPATCSLPGD